MDIQASTKQMEWDEDKSRKDSGLESGDVSEDSESAIVASSYSSGYDSSSGSKSKSLLKPRPTNQAGRNKEMLMVSVLKKVRCDTPKSPLSQQVSIQQPKETTKTINVAPLCKTKSSVQVDAPLKSLVKPPKPVQSSAEPVKSPPKAVEVKTQSEEEAADHPKNDTVNSTVAPAKVTYPIVDSPKATVKVEPSEALQSSETLVPVETKPIDVCVSVKPTEQPKKRKLNFEEYRNRQRAMEQKKESEVTSKDDLLSGKKTISGEIEATNSGDENPVKSTVIIKEEKDVQPVPHTSNISLTIKQEKDEMAVSNTTFSVAGNQESTPSSSHSKIATIKQEIDTVSVSEEPKNDNASKPAEEKKKQRQYRTRRMSTSSSDGSPQSKPVIKSRCASFPDFSFYIILIL